MIRLAQEEDIGAIGLIYEKIHAAEEAGRVQIGWIRGIYPTVETAKTALNRGDLFVSEENGIIVGAGIINQCQMDAYREGHWSYSAGDQEIMVLHTLVIDPDEGRKGYGRAFVRFYEDYAEKHKCMVLRMDTNARNQTARQLYRRLGYREADIVPCTFNGIQGVQLVLLEKRLAGGNNEE